MRSGARTRSRRGVVASLPMVAVPFADFVRFYSHFDTRVLPGGLVVQKPVRRRQAYRVPRWARDLLAALPCKQPDVFHLVVKQVLALPESACEGAACELISFCLLLRPLGGFRARSFEWDERQVAEVARGLGSEKALAHVLRRIE